MEEYENPYAPPKANLNPEENETNFLWPEASKTKRFLNHLIDTVVAYIIIFIFAFFSIAIIGNGTDRVGLQLFSYFILLLYYIIMESATQCTIGKMLTKTKVVDKFGNKPSFGQIVGRTFSRLIPFEAFSFFGSSDSGWHDRISGTKVIDVSSQKLQ